MSYDIPYMDYPIATGICNNCGEPIFQRIEASGYSSWKHEDEGKCIQGAVLMHGSWSLKPSDFQVKGEK